MFKSNLSPLNPNKDKYLNNNYPTSNNDLQNTSNHHQPAYQYKGIYTANNNNINYKQEMPNPHGNYNPPLSPLSPNISKNPMSPTAKIKMFSNTLTLNKKSSQNTNPLTPQNTQQHQSKQPKAFNKLGIKNLTLNLNQSLDLKCDQVLQQTPLTTQYRKQTPHQPIKQHPYTKRTGTKIPQLNLQAQLDDLKCDEVLQIRKDSQDDSRRNLRFNGNGYHGVLSNNDLENNFTYTNMGNKNFGYQNSNGEKMHALQAPLTPNYQKKKTIPLIAMRKNTDRDNHHSSNNSNPSSNTSTHPSHQQKPRSFTNTISPHIQSRHHFQQNNQQQHDSSPYNQSTPSLQQLPLQKKYQQMMRLVQRTKNVIQAYQKQAQLARQKFNQARDKLLEAHERNNFLEKENMQLRKCLYEEGSNSGRNNNAYNYPLTPGANRYQGVK